MLPCFIFMMAVRMSAMAIAVSPTLVSNSFPCLRSGLILFCDLSPHVDEP
jgi:hypothetical protein